MRHPPLVFHSRVDHRNYRYENCECQRCNPTPIALACCVHPLASEQANALIAISDAADKALVVLRRRAMRSTTSRPTIGEANLTLDQLELIFNTVQELLA